MTDKDRILELLDSVPKGPWHMLPDGASPRSNLTSFRIGREFSFHQSCRHG